MQSPFPAANPQNFSSSFSALFLLTSPLFILHSFLPLKPHDHEDDLENIMSTDYSLIIGPLLIGVVANAFIFGICCVQLLNYFTGGYRDSWYIMYVHFYRHLSLCTSAQQTNPPIESYWYGSLQWTRFKLVPVCHSCGITWWPTSRIQKYWHQVLGNTQHCLSGILC